jgi:hypothetical protein
MVFSRTHRGRALVALLFALPACTESSPSRSAQRADVGPTYHADVAPLLARSCGSCHVAGGLAPFALDSYESASGLADAIVAATEAGTMPPWGTAESDLCRPQHGWKGDVRLSPDELELLRAWRDDGTPEGDAAHAAELPQPPSMSLPDATVTLTPELPWVAQPGADQFRCFSLDMGLSETQWINGFQVVPGNRAVVHHVVLTIDPTGASLADVDETGSFDCGSGGTMDFPDPRVLGVWLPGGLPFELAPDIGVEAPAGSRLVMQIHYHTGGPDAAPDTTGVELRYTEGRPDYLMVPVGIGNFEKTEANGDGLQRGPNDTLYGARFFVPANVAGHTEEMVLTVPDTGDDGAPLPEIRVLGAAAHMHLVGTDLLVEVEKAPPWLGDGPECLLHEPHWSFDWQRTYLYDAPFESLPRLRPRDRIRVRCAYDNTLANPYVQRALGDLGLSSPVDVELGEGTLDEMCLAILPLVVPAE